MGRLREENAGELEEALVVRFLEMLLRYLLPGESIPAGSLCVTKLAELAARYVFPKTGDTKVSRKVVELVADQLPDPGWSIKAYLIYEYLDDYLPTGHADEYTKSQKVEALLRACAWGPEPGTPAAEDGETAEVACTDLCEIIGLVGYIGFLDLPDWLDYALLSPSDPDEFPGQVLYTLQRLMPDNETYVDLSHAADVWGKRAITALLEDSVRALEGKGYSAGYIQDARRHYEALKEWIGPLRTALMQILLSTAGEHHNIEDMVRSVSLLAQNGGIVAPSHYVQMDLAWAKARRAKGIWNDVDYRVIEGAGSVWYKGSGKTQRFVASGDVILFKELRIDGVPFHEGVNISSGSTIADISAKAMETLSVGKHTVTFVYVDGEASADFSVQKKLPPPTGDAGNPTLWFLLLILGAAGVCLLLRILPYTAKRRK